jgi:uncharacterized protein
VQNIAIVDAGPMIALFDKSDKFHGKAKASLDKYRSKKHGRLITTWPVISEVAYMLADHVHLQAELDLFTWIIEGGVEIFPLSADHLPQVIELQDKYSNIPMDFADATLVIVAREMTINKVFTVDDDFLIYRIFGKKHFENLL